MCLLPCFGASVELSFVILTGDWCGFLQGFICKALHERTECFFEAASVGYAYARMRGEPGSPLPNAMPGWYRYRCVRVCAVTATH